MSDQVESRKGTRKSRGSKERILKVAMREFAAKGLSGARVDRIAGLSKTSKNMIYYHFGNKAGLYREVMSLAYAGIRDNERLSITDLKDPVEALKTIISVSFNYHSRNETFVRLVAVENINKASHLRDLDTMKSKNRIIIETLSRILEAGQEQGVFRSDIDPVHLHLTISGLGFHYVSNRYTFSKLFDLDMSSAAARENRKAEVVDIVLRWCSA